MSAKGKQTKTAEPGFPGAFQESPEVHQLPREVEVVPDKKKKYIKPSSRQDPELEALQKFLINWINTTLKDEHIVVKNLEEDLYDGLVLHHLLEKFGSLTLEVEKIALTEKKQRLKLAVILSAVSQCLQLEESEPKWTVDTIFEKNLLSTLHLLVAIAQHFQPQLVIPPNVNVAVTTEESMSSESETEFMMECITKDREPAENSSRSAEIFDELLNHAPRKLDAVKEVFLKFVNKHVGRLGLNVDDVDSQFADGVILLLLIGELQGYFLNLGDFFLNPSSTSEMIHNVSLAIDLLRDGDLLDSPINPEDVVNQDTKSTLFILYCLFSKYKTEET
ncbi:gamma-parvin [Candoia aspera]|uniref:gamma-parvin n=1 Tax=Candoia aspera TaxID=51853 RepID=UPI002FD7DECD